MSRVESRVRTEGLVERVLAWYDRAARDLPWRAAGVSPYAVLVSEVMLQQTPVARVLPAFRRWMTRWPTVEALASASAGDVLREWGRLGYPRRALRLHAAAQACVELHDGQIPNEYAALRELPGIGDYTAAAVASFAYGQRHAVLDTNVRRVLARAVTGQPGAGGSVRAHEVRLASALLPEADTAPRWSVAVMELGALVCTARAPQCSACPISDQCAWRLAGYPAEQARARRPSQRFEGTDRQVRGLVMAVLRESAEAVTPERLDGVWPLEEQRTRALASLVADGLVVRTAEGYVLPA